MLAWQHYIVTTKRHALLSAGSPVRLKHRLRCMHALADGLQESEDWVHALASCWLSSAMSSRFRCAPACACCCSKASARFVRMRRGSLAPHLLPITFTANKGLPSKDLIWHPTLCILHPCHPPNPGSPHPCGCDHQRRRRSHPVCAALFALQTDCLKICLQASQEPMVDHRTLRLEEPPQE